MQTLKVSLGERAYHIHLGEDFLSDLSPFVAHFANAKVAILSNATIAPLYLAQLKKSLLNIGITSFDIILPDGEAYKNWQNLNLIFDALLKNHCERKTPLIALGGGVIGDMGGFAAACYQRGMPFVQIPTTLLAQVDSSVGGKTAINHPLGKNMIGAFYQPSLVLIDIKTLQTLPLREFNSGLAEVIKYGLIGDLPFFNWLNENMEKLMARDKNALQHAIYQSCAHKARVVAADEKETGERALLNFGHTFGHAIETGFGYGKFLHGEAVAIGAMMAAELSCALGLLQKEDVQKIEDLFTRAQLPVFAPYKDNFSVEDFVNLMAHDKKVEEGKLRLILLQKIGQAFIQKDVSTERIKEAIAKRTAKRTL